MAQENIEQDKIAFSVQMKAMDLFRFKMYHVYHGFSGLFGVCLALVAAIMLITGFKDMMAQSRAVMILIIVWFVIIDPLRFLTSSKSQIKLNKVYRKPLHYLIDQNGITVSQEETTQTLEWERFVKIVETGTQYIVYSSKIHAFIFPKRELGDQCGLLRNVLLSYGGANKVKMKGFPKVGKTA